MPPAAQSLSSDSKDRSKKPRHRHTAAQLAGLNELFDRDEHPPLDLRVSLAERLGMETKAVNSWFQNKRASSKKRTLTRSTAQYDVSPINSSVSSNLPSSFPLHSVDLDDYDDEYQPTDVPPPHSDYSRTYTSSPEHPHSLAEQDNTNRRARIRPTAEQVEQLKHLFYLNPHPSTEDKQALADRIGMRYQSITNWFQNQRSISKKRFEGDSDITAGNYSINTEYPAVTENRTYSAFPFPPPTHHPSLGLPPPSSHPSLPSIAIRGRRSLSPESPRRSSRRSATPYDNAVGSRPRRTRPEPFQLDALKDLFVKTAHPSIEERSALALQIGMDLGKVTNWFRNLRQTTRKRAKKVGSADDDEDDYQERDTYSTPVSRSGSPSSSTSTNDDSMMYDEEGPLHGGAFSDAGSEDEFEEAVTPSSIASRSPPPLNGTPSGQVPLSNLTLAALESTTSAEIEEVSFKSGIKVEDAMLLLTFHHQVVQ